LYIVALVSCILLRSWRRSSTIVCLVLLHRESTGINSRLNKAAMTPQTEETGNTTTAATNGAIGYSSHIL
jgi:hypothetical protein